MDEDGLPDLRPFRLYQVHPAFPADWRFPDPAVPAITAGQCDIAFAVDRAGMTGGWSTRAWTKEGKALLRTGCAQKGTIRISLPVARLECGGGAAWLAGQRHGLFGYQ